MLGGGQLGRYALLAAATMGYETVVLDPDPSAPAGVVAHRHLIAPFDEDDALRQLALDCDVVTTEFENPPAASLEMLAGSVPVAPRPGSVAIAQDRIAEKRFLVENGFPVGPHAVLEDSIDGSNRDLGDELFSGGAIVKTARLGYDGKGQRHVERRVELEAAWAELGGVACVVEARLDLLSEISVIVARTADAREAAWPVAENTHVDGILDMSVVPAEIDDPLADRAIGLAMAIADALDYVGVLAVEMFVIPGELGPDLLINELAPRPHNSGHWTLDASLTSQFDQQIRAVCGLGLGDTSMTAPAVAMVNLLGELWFDEAGARRRPDWSEVLDDPAAALHLYGKSEPRPGRKMGHLTVTGTSSRSVATRAVELRSGV
jgi:5-(carboxyamino)imidazole ribonucleotide synthase